MIIQAELKCKQTGCEADPCAVDKVIELPSPRFEQFSRALLADYDFIAENKNAIRRDDDARHCLLILDAEGTDGFLVDPQGYGKYMIQQSGHFEYDENLDAFYDYEKYGTERMNEEDGMFTDRGYIAYKGYYSMEEVMNGSPSSRMEMGGLSR